MSIDLVCSECRQLIRARPDQVGQWLTCAVCAGPVRIPARSTAQIPGPPARARRRSWKRLLLGSALGLVLFALLLGAARATWNLLSPARKFLPKGTLRDSPAVGDRTAQRMTPPNPVVVPQLNLIAPPLELAAVPLTAGPASGTLMPVARIDRCLTLTGPTKGDCFLTTTPGGKLQPYRGSTFDLAGSWLLPRPAYVAVLDAQRGRLYAAVAAPSSLILGPLGDADYASGDLEVFDITGVLAGKTRPGSTLRPLGQVPLKATVVSLALSPDGKALFYAADTGRQAHIARIDPLRWKVEQTLPLRGGSGNRLALSPDGKGLFLLSGARLETLDPLTLKPRASMILASAPNIMVAGRDGLLYLTDRRHFSEILVLDTAKRQIVGRWHSGMRYRCYLDRSADGRQLLLVRSAVADGEIRALSLTGEATQAPQVSASAKSSAHLLLRGPAFLSSCGKFVVSSAGQVFRLPSI